MDAYVGEIKMFGLSFAPKNWALCNGQLLAISQNTALFSLLGTTYGGNGTTNFALPNFQGITPIHAGNGAGLSPRDLGETGGSTTVVLNSNTVPPHNHLVNAVAGGGEITPVNNYWGGPNQTRGLKWYSAYAAGNTGTMPANILGNPVGGGQPHNNLMPYLAITFCIALQGIFPQRP